MLENKDIPEKSAPPQHLPVKDFSEAFMHVKISYRFPKEITTVTKVAQSFRADESKYVKFLTIPSVGWDVGPLKLLHCAGGNVKWYNPFGKHFSTFFEN